MGSRWCSGQVVFAPLCFLSPLVPPATLEEGFVTIPILQIRRLRLQDPKRAPAVEKLSHPAKVMYSNEAPRQRGLDVPVHVESSSAPSWT